MARVFIDGFEHGSPDLWDTVSDATVISSAGLDMDGNYVLDNLAGDNEWVEKNLSANSEYYIAFLWRPTDNTNVSIFGVSYDGNKLLGLRVNGSNNLEVYRNTTLISTGSKSISVSTTYLIEARFKISDTVGVAQIKVNGILDIDFSGDTKPGADTTINKIKIGYWPIASGYGSKAYFDNVVVDDAAWIGETKIQAIAPTAAGNATNWTPSVGSNYDCVDDIPPSDTEYVSTNTINLIDTYIAENLAGVIGTIKCVQIQTRIESDGEPTPSNVNLVARSGDTDYFSGDIAVPVAFKELSYLWETDPDTAAAWLEAGVNALQIGIKSKA